MLPRIYLAGGVTVEHVGGLIRPGDFPSRQGRVAFAYLVLQRPRAVGRDELAEALWPQQRPRSWERAVSALVSKLRRMLDARETGIRISGGPQGYVAALPAGAWVDLSAAANAMHDATGHLRDSRLVEAWNTANVACAIATREFLPYHDAEWCQAVRFSLSQTRLRGLQCLGEVALARGEHALASQIASDALGLDPARESAQRLLMRAHAAAGNRAEALRVYEEQRRWLAEELGADPSPETEALHLELLRSEPISPSGVTCATPA